MRKTLFAVSLSIILLGGMIPFGVQAAPADLPPIKIGHIVDLSGPEANVGKLVQPSLDFAFEAIGYQIAGRKVEIITGDAQSQPNTAVDVARKMVENDKVVAIFGPTQAGEKMAVAGYMNKVGIPLILYNPTPMGLYASGQIKWVVAAGGSERQNPTCMADYIFNQLKYKTINTITMDNTGGRMFLAPLTELFTKLGGQVVQQQWAPLPCPDFSPYLTTLKPADALVAFEPGSDALKFWGQYRQLGINKKMPVVASFHPITDPWIPRALPPEDAAMVVGVPAPGMYSPDSTDPVNQEFVKAFTAKFGRPPADAGSSCSYQGAIVFIEAVKALAGDTTPDKLLQAMLGAKVTGPEGPLSFPEGSMTATRNVYITKVKQIPNGFAYETTYTYKDVPPTGYVVK